MKRNRMNEGWITVLLLAAMSLCLSWTLQAVELTEGIGLLQLVVLGGTLIGLALARANVPHLVAHGASLIIGGGWAFFLAATRLPSQLNWMARFQAIQLRITDWWKQVMGGGESYDSLMFLLFAFALFWIFSYLAAYAVFKYRLVWLAIVPNGTVILMNAYYNPNLLPYFASYLLLSLLLIVRFTLYEKEVEWQKKQVRYNSELVLDFLRNGALTAFVILALVWFVPLSTSDYRDLEVWDLFMDPWEEIQFHWNRAFASLSGYGPPRFGFFTDNLTLSGPVTLGEDPVMAVESSDRQYWRALNFDAYTGRGWQNTDPEEVEVEASSTLPRPLPYDEREELVQTVQLYRSGEKVVFGANEISSVNREATARLVYVPPITQAGEEPPEEGAGEYGQISILASKLRFRRDEVYEAVSYVSTASPSMLREAGEAYPEWVLDRYLQLPEELPERITELTERLTTPYDNAYDKASAVQAYLREIEYNESIDAPPPGVDAVDWFLFDNRQGYCDYYSSAMAVMLRTIGIPTRVSRGYAAGQFYEETETYLVRELDAHAWPEIYFPRYGWIEFEPTASEPLLTRPEEDEASAAGAGPANLAGYEELEDDLFPEEDEMMNAPNTPWRPVETAPWWQRTDWMINLVPLIPILLGGALIWYLRRRRLAANTLVTVAFDNMLRYTRWLGIELRPNHTPYECAAALTAYANEGRKDAYYIADLYVQEHYSGKEITVYDEMNAMDAWRRLRRTLQAYLVAKLLPLKPEVAENLRSAMAPEPTSS